LWLMTVAQPADWRSESTVMPWDQCACGTRSQLTWRTRSALRTVPLHKPGTVSVPSGALRAGTVFTGIAYSNRASSAVTGSRR